MRRLVHLAHPLTIEEIQETGASFKEDLQREANRCVRRHDSARAMAALEAIDYIEKFIYTLKLRAGSQLGLPARARPINIIAEVVNSPKAKRAKRKRLGNKT